MTPRSLTAALWLLPAVALGTTRVGPPPGPVELARRADRVVLARVEGSRVDVPGGNPRRMLTVTTLQVLEEYKGQGPRRIDLVQLGGKYGLWESHVPGDAVFTAGETAVVFLRCKDAPSPNTCALVGLGEGKLPLLAAEGGAQREVLVRSGEEARRRPLKSLVDEIRQAGTRGPGAPQARGREVR